MADPKKLAAPGSPEELLVRRMDLSHLPRHVAIIMDGNGRWAKARGLPKTEGHRSGVEAVRDTVEAAAQLGLEALTLYAFSVENWKRPKYEVWSLMNLLKEYVRQDLQTLVKNGIRFRHVGRRSGLDRTVLLALDKATEATRGNKGLRLNVAVNYSGRSEIVDACRQVVTEWAAGERVEIDEETIGQYLCTAGNPDPDLLIRTSGEMRISNFLLWQLAYSELWFTQTLWPEFRRHELFQAILDFQQRDRRYGGRPDEGRPSESRLERGS